MELLKYIEYQNFVAGELKKRKAFENVMEKLVQYRDEFLCVFCIDLDGIHEKLRQLYSSHKVGKKPYDPQAILRSLLLMHAFQEDSITKWVKKMRTDPLVAIFSGMVPKKTPGVGTYYDFFKRFENGPHQKKCEHRILASERRKARSKLRTPQGKPTAREEHDVEDKKGIIRKLAEETISREKEPIPMDLERLLNEILWEVAVKASAQKGVIDDLTNLVVAGDGSTLPSAANVNGKCTCDCRKNGIFRCDHLRIFSDVDAQWGWDNRIKDFVFGYRFFQLVVPDNRHNLPIYLNIASANMHEAKMAIRALDRFDKQTKESGAKIREAAFDALFDMYPFYHYLVHKDIGYAIPYAREVAKCVTLGQGDQLFTAQGVPICPGGLPMIRSGLDRQGRDVYYCPVKRCGRRNGKIVRLCFREECPLGSLCEPESMIGPCVHVSPTLDVRIHPKIPRGSKRYTEICNMRGCCERSNSMKKHGYQLKNAKMRVMPYAFIRLALISILEHSKIWASQQLATFDPMQNSIFALFT